MSYDFDQEGMERFWKFVHERQEIFRRRFVEGEPEPWTDDTILQERHFCNVYRELDRVSRWYINEYVGLEHHVDFGVEDIFLSTIAFRIFNKPETMDIVGPLQVDDYYPKQVYGPIDKSKEDGRIDSVFNSAYMITGAVGESGEDKHRSYAKECFGHIADNIEYYWWDHFSATHPQELARGEPFSLEAHSPPSTFVKTLTTVPGVADFIAYEVYCDLTYHDWFPWNENDYVNTGPGARRGINWIFDRLSQVDEDEKPSTTEEMKAIMDRPAPVGEEEFIEYLRNVQDEWLPGDFYFWNDKKLTLRSIEHSLCEYDKYRRVEWMEENDEQQRMKRHKPMDKDLGIDNENRGGNAQDSVDQFL